MNYGLYQSASGMITSLHRQNVIANNLANSETVGFRRDFAMVQQRKLAAQELPSQGVYGEDMLNQLGGGQFLSRSEADFSESLLEETGKDLDVGLKTSGFLAVSKGGQQYLTRDGQFTIDTSGQLVLASDPSAKVLGKDLKPIVVDPLAKTKISMDGSIIQHNATVEKLAIKDVDVHSLNKVAGGLFTNGAPLSDLKDSANPWVVQGSVERSNVEPTTEITQLLEAQRQLEANANMIRYQDQLLGRVVNDVAKVS